MFPEWCARWAHRIRHSKALEERSALWDKLRPHYRRLISRLSGPRGLQVTVNGEDSFFLADYWAPTLEYEPKSYKLAMGLVRPKSQVVDVGAFHGIYTLGFCRRVGDGGRVLTIEPNSAARAILKRNLENNGLAARAIVDGHLIASIAGKREFYALKNPAFVGGGFSSAIPELPEFERAEVAHHRMETTTLDKLCHEHRIDPDVVKVDVEGYEFEVLRGSTELLRGQHTIFMVELHPTRLARRGESVAEFKSWLRERSYLMMNEHGGRFEHWDDAAESVHAILRAERHH